MKPKFKLRRDCMDGWRLEVVNDEAHKLALWMQKNEVALFSYTICNTQGNLIGNDQQDFYYYDIPQT